MSESIVSCKNCGNQFSGKYCNRCGEKVYNEHDKSVLHFFEEALHFLTHFEGTFFTTLKTIFSRPGRFSLEFCSGQRKKYFKPLPFFMLLVVLYLIFPFFTGLNMPFTYYLQKNSYASAITAKRTGINIDALTSGIDSAVAAANFESSTMAFQYRKTYTDSVVKNYPALKKIDASFNKKSEKISKLLLLILLPLTALVLWLLSIRKHRYFFDELVLSTEINSFFILFSFFIVPLFVTVLYKISPQLASTILNEASISIFSYGSIGIFCAVAFRTFYKDKWWWSVLKSILVIIAHAFIVQVIYKFALFVFTFYLSA